MGFERVCAADEVGAGEMQAFYLGGWEVLVVRDGSGTLRAMDGICPHEDYPLIEGLFDGTVLTCANHMWSFDTTTGKGINPPGCRLSQYAIRVEDGDVFVDTDAEPGAQP